MVHLRRDLYRLGEVVMTTSAQEASQRYGGAIPTLLLKLHSSRDAGGWLTLVGRDAGNDGSPVSHFGQVAFILCPENVLIPVGNSSITAVLILGDP